MKIDSRYLLRQGFTEIGVIPHYQSGMRHHEAGYARLFAHRDGILAIEQISEHEDRLRVFAAISAPADFDLAPWQIERLAFSSGANLHYLSNKFADTHSFELAMAALKEHATVGFEGWPVSPRDLRLSPEPSALEKLNHLGGLWSTKLQVKRWPGLKHILEYSRNPFANMPANEVAKERYGERLSGAVTWIMDHLHKGYETLDTSPQDMDKKALSNWLEVVNQSRKHRGELKQHGYVLETGHTLFSILAFYPLLSFERGLATEARAVLGEEAWRHTCLVEDTEGLNAPLRQLTHMRHSLTSDVSAITHGMGNFSKYGVGFGEDSFDPVFERNKNLSMKQVVWDRLVDDFGGRMATSSTNEVGALMSQKVGAFHEGAVTDDEAAFYHWFGDYIRQHGLEAARWKDESGGQQTCSIEETWQWLEEKSPEVFTPIRAEMFNRELSEGVPSVSRTVQGLRL